jgi:hypothetical protein
VVGYWTIGECGALNCGGGGMYWLCSGEGG